MRFCITALLIFLIGFSTQAQVKSDRYVPPKGKPKNIIILIGHGLGMDQVAAGMIKNKGNSNLGNFPVVGFINPVSGNKVISDPMENISALAYGDTVYKTTDGGITQKSLFDWAKEKKMATAIVTTTSVTDKVPAAFLTTQANLPGESIGRLYLEKEVDYIVGGGKKYFLGKDKQNNLLTEFDKRNYVFEDNPKKVRKIGGGKTLALIHEGDFYGAMHRKDYLSEASLSILGSLRAGAMFGFIAIVESDQIAKAAAINDLGYMADEVKDFDKVAGDLFSLFGKDDQTLFIVMGDGEVGGLSISSGDINNGHVKGSFSSKDGTIDLAPVFAVGPGSQQFGGIYTSKEMYKKILSFIEDRK